MSGAIPGFNSSALDNPFTGNYSNLGSYYSGYMGATDPSTAQSISQAQAFEQQNAALSQFQMQNQAAQSELMTAMTVATQWAQTAHTLANQQESFAEQIVSDQVQEAKKYNQLAGQAV